MSQETQRGPIEPDETTVIPYDGKTKLFELAWSRDETEDFAVSHRSRWLPIALVGTAAIALVGVSAVYFTEHRTNPSAAPSSVPPSPTTPAAAVAPPPATVTLTELARQAGSLRS